MKEIEERDEGEEDRGDGDEGERDGEERDGEEMDRWDEMKRRRGMKDER